MESHHRAYCRRWHYPNRIPFPQSKFTFPSPPIFNHSLTHNSISSKPPATAASRTSQATSQVSTTSKAFAPNTPQNSSPQMKDLLNTPRKLSSSVPAIQHMTSPKITQNSATTSQWFNDPPHSLSPLIRTARAWLPSTARMVPRLRMLI